MSRTRRRRRKNEDGIQESNPSQDHASTRDRVDKGRSDESARPTIEERGRERDHAEKGITDDEKSSTTEAAESGSAEISTCTEPEHKATTTEAKAKVKVVEQVRPTHKPKPKVKIKRPMCPVCKESRGYANRRGETLVCTNCRRTVTLI